MNTNSSFTNRLAQEKSPYLLQHQHNPVQWYPWGPEAFAKARAEGKPIFLSVGYSTCHWCHVMAHESFEDAATAKLMNEHFVNIKVDREERPDVDRVYMTYVQATSGSGGWPMSVFLTPDLQPFYGGTYYPPRDNYGRPGFPTVLRRLAEAWEQDRAKVLESASNAVAALREYTAPQEYTSPPQTGGLGHSQISACYDQLARSYDEEWGGFGGSPKFPHPVSLNLLFRLSATGTPQQREPALHMALGTLRKMAEGGMHDHLGGGFHRYSVDRFWHIPHFEKMLYDQAQLACSYLDAFQVTGAPEQAVVVRDILDYVLRDLSHPEGGFYSAEDADSLLQAGQPEHGEGAFYVWTRAEIEQALGAEEAPLFMRFYGVEEEGNSPAGSDPHGELKGKNTLIQRMTLAEAAAFFHRPEEKIATSLAASRAKLLALRSHRPRPHLDDKIITAWNGYMISALARAAQTLREPRYLQAAQRAATFLRQQLWQEGRLIRSYRQGASAVPGFADDYAALIAGLLDLYEADFDIAWLQWAFELQAAMDQQFWDAKYGGYFSAGADASDLLLRLKEDYDGAEPSPNSTAALNLWRLSQIGATPAWQAQAERTVQAFGEQLSRAPSALPQMLCAVEALVGKHCQIVIAGAPGAEETEALLGEVYRRYLPNKVLLLAEGGSGQEWLGRKLEFLRTVGLVGGKSAAYYCENFVCQLPVTEPAKLREELVRAGKK